MSNETWEDVSAPDIIKEWEQGDTAEGYFQRMETIPNNGDPFDVMVFMREDGTRWQTSVSGGLVAVAKDLIPGAYYRLTQDGERDTGKPQPMKLFKVAMRGTG